MSVKNVDWESAAIWNICDSGTFEEAANVRLNAGLFTTHSEQFGYITEHNAKHGKPPSLSKLEDKFPSLAFDETESNISEITETLRELKVYRSVVTSWLEIQETFKKAAGKGSSLSSKVSGAGSVLETMRQCVMQYDEEVSESEEVRIDENFIDNFDEEYRVRQASDGVIGVPFMWPTATKLSQGLIPGDICVVAARNGVGKTWCILAWSIFLWLEHGYPILWISNEMTLQALRFRVMAVVMQTHYGDLKSGSMCEEEYLKALSEAKSTLGRAEKMPFIFSSAEDGTGVGGVLYLANRVKKMRKDLPTGSKDVVVFIDGAYLLSDDRNARDANQAVRNIVDDLKDWVKHAKLVAIMSWQLNRGATRGSSEERNLAYTDKINAHSSYMLGIERDEETIERKEAVIRSLKSRECEPFVLNTEWCFKTMSFKELQGESDLLPSDDLDSSFEIKMA